MPIFELHFSRSPWAMPKSLPDMALNLQSQSQAFDRFSSDLFDIFAAGLNSHCGFQIVRTTRVIEPAELMQIAA